MSSRSGNFTVSLKIGGKEVQLVINSSESLDDVFQKLTNLYPQCSNNKSTIIQKLTNNLRQQLHNQTLTDHLNESISKFLNKNSQTKTKSASKHNLSIYSNTSQPKHPKKVQKEEPIIKESHERKKSSVIHYKREGRDIPRASGKSFVRSSQKRNHCNPDLIKACQIIMKKTQNTDMKQMAREFLKEKGYLKDEKDSHKKHLISELSNVYCVDEQSREQPNTNEVSAQKVEQTIKTSKIVPKPQEGNLKGNDKSTRRQNSRSTKYNYLQSSLVNESLHNNYENSSIMNVSEFRPKRYSYLQY